MRGTIGYFLVDSGAVVTCVGRKSFDNLSGDKVFFDNSLKPVTITGAPLRQYGQAILPLEIGVKMFHYAPSVSNISEDGIFGAEFLQYYECELGKAGVLYIHNPYRLLVHCELCRDSETTSAVAQDVRIAPMSSCDVKITAIGIDGDHQSVFEPLSVELHELGLKGQNT